jgi:hypothetical protein
MKDIKSPKLRMLRGKTVYNVEVSTAHGELLELTFTDGTTLVVCSVVGTDMEKTANRDDIYVSVDDVCI